MSESPLIVEPLRAFADNYIWLLTSTADAGAVVVDPGDAGPVLDYLQRSSKMLAAILITHHHSDHVGGISRLRASYPDVPVYGPARERIREVTEPLREGDIVTLPFTGAELTAMEVPGHTAGHIAYLGDSVLFCGDTVFAAGCGRVFDGTFEDLAKSLIRISQLPPETLLYCAHEYTVDNIGFAKWVEPDNAALQQRDIDAMSMVERGEPTVPSTLALELETNPFLRLSQPAVIAAAKKHMKIPTDDPIAVFTALRQWKDREYD